MGSGWVGDYAPAPPPNANPAARQRKTSAQNRGVGAWPGFSIQDPWPSSLEDPEINHLYSLFIQVRHLLLIKPGASTEEPLCWWLTFQFRLDIQPQEGEGARRTSSTRPAILLDTYEDKSWPAVGASACTHGGTPCDNIMNWNEFLESNDIHVEK